MNFHAYLEMTELFSMFNQRKTLTQHLDASPLNSCAQMQFSLWINAPVVRAEADRMGHESAQESASHPLVQCSPRAGTVPAAT